jgi:ring-1,2-phenylacetyl-CoA epoxidase subunit PaaC
MYTGELFAMSETEQAMQQEGLAPDLTPIKTQWQARVQEVLGEATLSLPSGTWSQQGGKEGRHSEHLGFVLAELQFMQRTYPGMEW